MKGIYVIASFLVLISSVSGRVLDEIPTAPNVESLCPKTGLPDPSVCITTIKSSPRNDLKNTPQGGAWILVDAAKEKVQPTISFINEIIMSEKNEDLLSILKSCLKAFEFPASDLAFEPAILNTPPGRAQSIDTLKIKYGEMWDGCRTDEKGEEVDSPVLEQMNERVDSFLDLLTDAIAILEGIK